MRVRTFWPAVPLALFALFALAPGLVRAAPAAQTPQLRLAMPTQAALGDTITVRATLTDAAGAPIPSATLTFLSPVVWSSDIKGDAELGTATTDASGVAVFSYQMRRAGDVSIIARFAGAPGVEAASSQAAITVVGENQLYLPRAGIRVSALGPWLIALVIGTVWGLYFLVALKVLAISRTRTPALQPAAPTPAPGRGAVDRRQFLTQAVVPLGMLTAIAAVGSGLVTMVVRSPYTHWNLSRNPAGRGYRRTPFVRVGAPADMMAMPAVLPREVSFSREVLPLLLARGGPHAYPPKNSPPPGGVQLDTYEHIMEKEGLVVPGDVEQSRLMGVLLDRSMGMPPAGELFSMEEVQVIASWIAQGAKNT